MSTIKRASQWDKKADPISNGLEDAERSLKWLRLLKRHRRALDSIADVVELDTLWDYAPRGSGGYLHLAYAGEARNHRDAGPDLSRIMEALHCKEMKLHVVGGGTTYPHGQYVGQGRLGNKKLTIHLSCRWLPEGCRITQSTPQRTWHTTRRYSAVCSL